MAVSMLVRADVGPHVGCGHAMRCLALAQAWRDAGREVSLLSGPLPDSLRKKLEAEGIAAAQMEAPAGSDEDAKLTTEAAVSAGADWVVTDGYVFDANYQRRLKTAGLRLAVIDDHANVGAYLADVVIDQNAGASEAGYVQREPYTKLLLGSRFALLRREFRAWGYHKRDVSHPARRILVALGGGDERNDSALVLKVLGEVAKEDLDVTVVVGPQNPHLAGLSSVGERLRFPVRLREDPDDMAMLMAQADLIVVAGGITTWEALYMGLPVIVVFATENQRPNAERLGRLGVALNLGSADELDARAAAGRIADLIDGPSRRGKMAETGHRLVDGEGVHRVRMHLEGRRLRLRPASAGDSQMLFEWANDPEARAVSFSSRPIAVQEHEAWLDRKLSDPGSLLLIALDEEDCPVGQVRFDLEGDEAVVSVGVDKTRRGAGLGKCLIELGVEELAGRGYARVRAFIKPENSRSARAFEKAGFHKAGEQTVKGQPALVYVRNGLGGR